MAGKMSDEHKAIARAFDKAGALIDLNADMEITTLRCVGRRTRDEHLEMLSGLHSLRKLILSYTAVTDSGHAHLANLKDLEQLSLFRNDITDQGLVHLKGLTALQQLNLESTKVSDGGLVHLQGLKALQRLSIDHDSVTQPAIEVLQGHLPNCEMYR